MTRLFEISACLAAVLIAFPAAAATHLPTHIDTLSEQEVLDNANHSGSFGAAVAIDPTNTLALVGAPLDPYGAVAEQGAVFAYALVNGQWQLTQQLLASSNVDGGSFGFSIAISGTTAIIGAYSYGTTGSLAIGKAYIFNYANGVWTRAAELMAVDADEVEEFGYSVAIDGSTALIGAPEFGSEFGKRGSAYVFKKNAFGLWLQSQKLTGTDQTLEGEFGHSVALLGDTAAIGQLHSSGGSTSTIYIFTNSGTSWTQSQALVEPDEAGYALAMNASTLVAGAPTRAVGGNVNQGAAYVFQKTNGTWSQSQLLTVSTGHQGDLFGTSVAIKDSELVVGAMEATILGHTYQGAAYYFSATNGQYGSGTRIVASNGMATDFFGESVAIGKGTSSLTYLVGAPGVRKSGSYVGAAYFYSGP